MSANTSAIAQSNAQKAKDWTTVAVVLGVAAAAVTLSAPRTFLLSLHASSTLGAFSLYAGVLALIVVCYKSLMNNGEWRGGGVSGILNSHEGDGFHAKEVSGLVNGYYDNFGAESRSDTTTHCTNHRTSSQDTQRMLSDTL